MRFRKYETHNLIMPIDEWSEGRWLRPDDEDCDIAIAPYDGQHPFEVGYTNIDTQGWDLCEFNPTIGSDVLYVGLFTAADHLGIENAPMVRSGVLGAFCQEVHPTGASKPYLAHLIDARSRGGFSGSPVFYQLRLPDDAKDIADWGTRRRRSTHHSHRCGRLRDVADRSADTLLR